MCFQIKNQQVDMRIFVKPNAKRTALVKITKEGFYIALHAKPHEGEANKELISFLSDFFQIPKSSIILQRGEKSRHKMVRVPLTTEVQQFLDFNNC